MLSFMSIDELNRILAISKWALGILALLTALAGIFNQWGSDRIGVLQAEQKIESQKKLAASESELRQTKTRTEQLEARFAPRELSATQVQSIKEHLKGYAGTQFQFVSYQDDEKPSGSGLFSCLYSYNCITTKPNQEGLLRAL